MPSYTHFTLNERKYLQEILDSGAGIRDAARQLGRSPSSVSREIRRNRSQYPKKPTNPFHYNHWRAQTLANWRCESGKRRKYPPDASQWDYVTEKLRICWSPEQIVNRWHLEHPDCVSSFPCFSTIYRYIHAHLLEGISARTHLRRRGKRKYSRKSSFGTIKPDRLIEDWPAEIRQRTMVGHWQGDTVLGGVGKGGLVTLVDRKTHYLTARLIMSRNALETKEALVESLKRLPVKSLSFDNGSEFSMFHEMEAELDATVYFAHPHSPWERGLNENTNDLLRFFFPKGFDFTSISQLDVDFVVDLINNRPRKSLAWISPAELMHVSLLSSLSSPVALT